MKISVDVEAAQRMNLNELDVPLTFSSSATRLLQS